MFAAFAAKGVTTAISSQPLLIYGQSATWKQTCKAFVRLWNGTPLDLKFAPDAYVSGKVQRAS